MYIEDLNNKKVDDVVVLENIKKNDLNLQKALVVNLCDYITKNFVDTGRIRYSVAPRRDGKIPVVREKIIPLGEENLPKSKSTGLSASLKKLFIKKELEGVVAKEEQSFSEELFSYIDAKGLTDAEVYKRVNVDRRLFSKIRTNKDYQPSRDTTIKLMIALELDLFEAEQFMGKAGYALSNSSKRDLIIKYFVENKLFDFGLLNDTLFAFEEDTLD